MAKTRKTYRSMRGKPVDMDLLMKKNELTPAVGNAKVNARGDQLGAGGQILKKREDLVSEYYNVAGVVGKDGGAAVVEEIVDAPEAKKSTKKAATKQPEPELTVEEQEMMEEAASDDEWIEDSDGNFVKKDS
mgnify:CR=1 FL=1|jgi:hypothetical protein|tara:strand:+ start:10194 stop:10589 length:396 start_codon:yes stop_codon:yes gene_type:complete